MRPSTKADCKLTSPPPLTRTNNSNNGGKETHTLTRGFLSVFRVSIDSYMNIQLAEAQEYIKNNFSGSLGQVLIRCNNVLWIRAAGPGENGDVKMEG